MDIYTLLKADHKKVKLLFAELTAAASEKSGSRAKALLKKIEAELVPHNQAEEEVFYARLTKSRESRVLSIEGTCEHDIGGKLLTELTALPGESDEFAAKAKILRELIEHHIKEEEGEIHKQTKREFSAALAQEMGAEFVALKKKLMTEVNKKRKPLRPNLVRSKGDIQSLMGGLDF
jgi:hemerythrin-like domain-containing protein